MIPILGLAVVIVVMLVELGVSRRNERMLLEHGAVAVDDPVYRTMRWAYPAVFAAMALEGALTGPVRAGVLLSGIALFLAGKLLKYWAIATLGTRWTFRVFMLPATPLVKEGPYRYLRHPNYLGVIGELAGMALIVGAAITGPLGLAFFSWLLAHRIRAEEKALY